MDIGSLVSSIVGLGTKIGTSVGGLRKPKKSNSGSQAARGAQRNIQRAIVGGSQSGHGASRGLALREGLRAAVDSGKYADQAAAAAVNDDRIHQQNMDARNKRLADFGGDLAKGLGDMAAMQVTPKGGSDLQDPGRAPVEINSETGFGTPQDEANIGGDNLASLEAGLVDQQQVEQEQFIDDAGQRLEDFRLQREEAGIPGTAEMQEKSTADLIEDAYERAPQLAPELERELEEKHVQKQLMFAEAERLGMDLETMIPRINRRLGLNPGEGV